MDRRERYADQEETLRIAAESNQRRLWTAMPGIVSKFDPIRHTCNVDVAISLEVRTKEGTTKEIKIPTLLDCPIQFPGGGGVTLTFPLKVGDEVLVVFSARCIDSWWELGGIQRQAELRMHDLSDGFVIPAIRSQPNKFTVSTSGAQLRTDDGHAYIELNPTTHNVKVQTTGDLEAVATGKVKLTSTGDTEIMATGDVKVTAVNIELNGIVKINGTIYSAHTHSVAAAPGVTGPPI